MNNQVLKKLEKANKLCENCGNIMELKKTLRPTRAFFICTGCSNGEEAYYDTRL